VIPCDWEGNRRSGVALAMRHRLHCFIDLRAHGQRKADDHPAYTPLGMAHFTLYTVSQKTSVRLYVNVVHCFKTNMETRSNYRLVTAKPSFVISKISIKDDTDTENWAKN